MRNRVLSRTVNLFKRQSAAGKLPAALVLGLLITLAFLQGCESMAARKEVLAMDGADGVYARGHAVSGRMLAGRLYYRMQSVHAGRDVAMSCQSSQSTVPDRRLVVRLQDCVPGEQGPLEAAELAQIVSKAVVALETYFPHATTSEVEFVAVPFGTRFYSSKRYWRHPRDLGLRISFWYAGESDALRQAVRSFAHEFTHLARRAARISLPYEQSEYMASTAEDCVELAVFGDLEGGDEEGADRVLSERVQAKSLSRTVGASQSAANKTRDILETAGTEGVARHCQQVLSL